MLLDAANLFSDAQVVTTGSENGVISTSSIDLGAAAVNIGAGERLWVVISIDTAMTSGSSDDTLTVDLVTDDNAGINSATLIQTLGVFPAVSAAGTRIIAPVPFNAAYERYIALRYTAATGALTAGAFTAFITKDIDSYKSYPKGYTIS
jgi:hypothetical protein